MKEGDRRMAGGMNRKDDGRIRESDGGRGGRRGERLID